MQSTLDLDFVLIPAGAGVGEGSTRCRWPGASVGEQIGRGLMQ